MRKWIIAVCAVLSLGAMAAPPVEATPAMNDNPVNLAQAASPAPQGAPPGASHHRRGNHRNGHHRHHRRYQTVCHNVRVWKWTHHGRVPVWERRCHKVWR